MDIKKTYASVLTGAFKIGFWLEARPILKKLLFVITFPISFPLDLMGAYGVWIMTRRSLSVLSKTKDENKLYTIAGNYLRFKCEQTAWRAKISEKWFCKNMMNISRKLYDTGFKELKQEITFEQYSAMVDIYMKYPGIVMAKMNPTGNTIINFS